MKKALLAMLLMLTSSISLTAFTATKLFAYQDIDPHYQTSENSALDLELRYPQGWTVEEAGQDRLYISENGPSNYTLFIAKFKNTATYQSLEEWKLAEPEYLKDFNTINLNGKKALISPQENLVVFLADQGNSHYFIRNGEGMIPELMNHDLFMTMASNIQFLEV